jgi:hypothetical protein
MVPKVELVTVPLALPGLPGVAEVQLVQAMVSARAGDAQAADKPKANADVAEQSNNFRRMNFSFRA